MRIDLHTHSTSSDGLLSPTQLLNKAKREKVRVLALTDHETLSGIPEAKRVAKKNKIVFITGIEIAFAFPDISWELHLVGLGTEQPSASLRNILKKQTNARVERIQQTVSRLQRDGFAITLADIRKLGRGQFGRPHIARVLLNHPANRKKVHALIPGRGVTVSKVINDLISPGKPYYVPRWTPSAKATIGAIHSSGGLAVFAHPYGLSGISLVGTRDWKSVIVKLARIGLDGLEVYAYGQKPGIRKILRTLAKKHSLFVTGGSDYHSEKMHKDQRLGYAMKGLPLLVTQNQPLSQKGGRSALHTWLTNLTWKHL